MNLQMHSDQINEITMAMSKVQGVMKPAVKDSKNPFFKSNYADITACMDACREPMTQNNLAIFQPTYYDEAGKIYILSILSHTTSGQFIKSYTPVLMQKVDCQSFGAALTYTRRYALSSLIGICTEDDDGNAASGKTVINAVQQPQPTKISKEQFTILSKKLDLVPQYKAQVKEWLSKQGIIDLMDVHASMFDGIIKAADKANEMTPVEKSA
jgi:hypothetical protein